MFKGLVKNTVISRLLHFYLRLHTDRHSAPDFAMYHTDKETRAKFYESFGKTEDTVIDDVKTGKTCLETQTHLPKITVCAMELPDSETRRNFYASFDKNEQAVAEDVKTIKTWLQSQTHHPEVMDDVKIRNILHLCKFRMDKTKEKIDNYYTFSSKHPSFFQDSNPKVDSLRDAMEKNYLCFHPKLLDNMHRLCFIKPKEKDTYVPASIVKLCFSMLEIMLQEDFMMHQTMVVDMSTLSFRDICKVSPKLLMTTFQVYKNIFSMRAHTVYLINSPSYITIWMTLFKFIFPAKIFNKFQVYKDSEILKERLPCDVLPVDYGGQGPSLEELTDLMKKKFAEYQERFDLLDTFRVERRS